MDNIKPIGSNRNDSSQNNDTEGVENAFLKKLNNLTIEERRKKNLAENALPHLSIAQQNLLNQLLVLLQQAGLINVSSQSTQQTDYSQSILAALAALAKSLGLPENKSTYQQLLDKISAHSASQQSLANSASNPQSSRSPMTTLSEEVANHLKKNQADEPSNPVLSPLSASKLLNATSMSSAQQTLTNNAFAQTTLINQLQQAATQNIIANTPNNSLTYRFKKWNKDDAVNISTTLATGSVTLEPSTPTVKQRLGEQLAKNTTELPNIRIVGSNANPDEPQEGRN
jgi:hypothetical protein